MFRSQKKASVVLPETKMNLCFCTHKKQFDKNIPAENRLKTSFLKIAQILAFVNFKSEVFWFSKEKWENTFFQDRQNVFGPLISFFFPFKPKAGSI